MLVRRPRQAARLACKRTLPRWLALTGECAFTGIYLGHKRLEREAGGVISTLIILQAIVFHEMTAS